MDEAAWQFASWKSGTRSPELKRFRPDVKHYRRAGTECAGSHYGHAVGIEVETISIPRRHSRRTKDHRGFGNENVELDEFCHVNRAMTPFASLGANSPYPRSWSVKFLFDWDGTGGGDE